MYIRITDVRHIRNRLEELDDLIQHNEHNLPDIRMFAFTIWQEVMIILDGEHLED